MSIKSRINEFGCTERLGSTTNGYARATRDGKWYLAHRLAWIDANGPVKDGLLVLHKCDNRRCINVEHLFLGTNKDNTQDMITKGRAKIFKLNKREVWHLRRLKYSGFTHKKLAVLFGISISNVNKIMGRITWA